MFTAKYFAPILLAFPIFLSGQSAHADVSVLKDTDRLRFVWLDATNNTPEKLTVYLAIDVQLCAGEKAEGDKGNAKMECKWMAGFKTELINAGTQRFGKGTPDIKGADVNKLANELIAKGKFQNPHVKMRIYLQVLQNDKKVKLDTSTRYREFPSLDMPGSKDDNSIVAKTFPATSDKTLQSTVEIAVFRSR